MRNRDFALCVLIILVAAVAISGMVLYSRGELSGPSSQNNNQGQTAYTTTGAPTFSGAQGPAIEIVSASLSSSSGYLTIQVENVGSANLVGLQLDGIEPYSSYGYSAWTPNPAQTYPIYTGETVSGRFLMTSQYRQGIQVSITVEGFCSLGGQGQEVAVDASYTLTVGS